MTIDSLKSSLDQLTDWWPETSDLSTEQAEQAEWLGWDGWVSVGQSQASSAE